MSEAARSDKSQGRLEGAEEGPEQEVEEVLMVEDPHAVAHPGAMMVHPADAGIADRAVMRPRRLDLATLAAVAIPYVAPHQSVKISVYSILDLLLSSSRFLRIISSLKVIGRS